MDDKKTDEQIQFIDANYLEWLAKNNVDLIKRPIEELLGDAYFAGFEKAMDIVQRSLYLK